MPDNYLTRTSFRTGPNQSAARDALAPLRPHLRDYYGAINPGRAAGEVTVVLYVRADSNLGAAKAAIGVVERCFADARRVLPGHLSPLRIESIGRTHRRPRPSAAAAHSRRFLCPACRRRTASR